MGLAITGLGGRLLTILKDVMMMGCGLGMVYYQMSIRNNYGLLPACVNIGIQCFSTRETDGPT
jgi:hypothetical protein